MKTRYIILDISLILIAIVVFAASAYAHRNNQGKSGATSTPFQTSAVKLNPTKTPSPKPSPIRTASPTKTPSQTITPNPTPTATPNPTVQGKTTSVYTTYYGWNDNNPPGTDIAYPKSSYATSNHNTAGGTGTFDDPVTFAADPNIFTPGTKIYVPYIKKYIIMEDKCAGCTG